MFLWEVKLLYKDDNVTVVDIRDRHTPLYMYWRNAGNFICVLGISQHRLIIMCSLLIWSLNPKRVTLLERRQYESNYRIHALPKCIFWMLYVLVCLLVFSLSKSNYRWNASSKQWRNRSEVYSFYTQEFVELNSLSIVSRIHTPIWVIS